VSTRYRCAACGNLTRFDVTVTRRTRAFHHYSIGGELVIEDTEVLSETVEEVACRWCGSGGKVEVVEDADSA
jgi:DNA-directed RNA polymerase subunit RPC12/RpoP